MENKLNETQKFSGQEKITSQEINIIKEEAAKSKAGFILEEVYSALKDKGYNPVNQIVGYILSGDPTYITSHNNARSLISKIERDELLEEIVNFYLKNDIG